MCGMMDCCLKCTSNTIPPMRKHEDVRTPIFKMKVEVQYSLSKNNRFYNNAAMASQFERF